MSLWDDLVAYAERLPHDERASRTVTVADVAQLTGLQPSTIRRQFGRWDVVAVPGYGPGGALSYHLSALVEVIQAARGKGWRGRQYD